MIEYFHDMGMFMSYISALQDRLMAHHAANVREVVPRLEFAVVAAADPPTAARPWAVRMGWTAGRPAVQFRVFVGGERYVFGFDRHADAGAGAVAVKRGNQMGTVVARFTNGTPQEEIVAVLARLAQANVPAAA